MTKYVLISADTRDVCTESPIYGVRSFDHIKVAEAEMWDRFKADLDADSICEVRVNGDKVICINSMTDEFPTEQWNKYANMTLDEAIELHGHGEDKAIWSVDVVVYTGNGGYEGIYHSIEAI